MSFRPSTWRLRAAAGLVLLLGLTLALAGRVPDTLDRDPAFAPAEPRQVALDRATGPGAAAAPGRGAGADAGGRPAPAAALASAGAERLVPDRGPGPGVAVGLESRAAAATGGSVPGPGAAAGPGGERGPSCDPGGHGQGAGVLPWAGGQEHVQLAAGRYAPAQVRPHDASRARVPVRGPDRPAPKPVELSVMRV